MTGAVLTPSAAAQRQKADRLSIADCNCYSQQNSQILELMVPAVSRPRRYDEARPMRLFSSLPGGPHATHPNAPLSAFRRRPRASSPTLRRGEGGIRSAFLCSLLLLRTPDLKHYGDDRGDAGGKAAGEEQGSRRCQRSRNLTSAGVASVQTGLSERSGSSNHWSRRTRSDRIPTVFR
jgi:hypothetical protein